MAYSMRKPCSTKAFLQLGSAAHRHWHRNLFARYTFSNGTTLTRPCCFPQSPILYQQELAHAQICTSAQSKLASPMTSMSTRRSKKTLIVLVDCYLMNSNWIFSERDPYNSSSSPWSATVIATTPNHNPASYVLAIRPHSIMEVGPNG